MDMSRRNLIGLGTLAVLPVLSGCSTLSAFNTLTPKDSGSKRIAHDIAYGPDQRQRYDVYAPLKPEGPCPLIVFFYGGGWNSGSKSDYGFVGRALAALGYVAVIPDYRLVPAVRFPLFLEDCVDAVRHAVTQAPDYKADGTRLSLIGHSAGAYNAVMLALDPRYLGTASQGIKTVVGLSGPYDFLPFDVPASVNAFGQWPRPAETQPIHFARKTDTRFLLIQSRDDTVVYLKNAVNLDQALKAAGTSSRLIVYDGLVHQDTAAALSIPFRGKAPVLKEIGDFLKGAV